MKPVQILSRGAGGQLLIAGSIPERGEVHGPLKHAARADWTFPFSGMCVFRNIPSVMSCVLPGPFMTRLGLGRHREGADLGKDMLDGRNGRSGEDASCK